MAMNKKLQSIILITYVIALIIMIIGASYAYFTVIKVSSVSPELEVKSATSNYIIFSVDNALEINIDNSNFKPGAGNAVSKANASAYVKVDTGEGIVSYKYNLTLNIESNNLEYSTTNKSPELILTVKDPNGNQVTNITGLNYVTVNGISGFDITESTGTYYIASNYTIQTSTEIMQNWETTITFVNLEESQNVNLDKNLSGYIKLEKAE